MPRAEPELGQSLLGGGAGAGVHATDEYGENALHKAVKAGDPLLAWYEAQPGAAALPDGKVLVAGGRAPSADGDAASPPGDLGDMIRNDTFNNLPALCRRGSLPRNSRSSPQ